MKTLHHPSGGKNMITKLLALISIIIVIFMSAYVLLKINSEQNRENLGSDTSKFIGKWKLIRTEADTSDNEISDTTEEPDTYPIFETYEFLTNGTYYHVVDVDNSSGSWKINTSHLILTSHDPFEVIPISYTYVFSDDVHTVTLTVADDPEKFLEFEKIMTG
jgi:hypothetical protein